MGWMSGGIKSSVRRKFQGGSHSPDSYCQPIIPVTARTAAFDGGWELGKGIVLTQSSFPEPTAMISSSQCVCQPTTMPGMCQS